jgi:hypothetical protein
MTKRKRTKGQTLIYKTLRIESKERATWTPLKFAFLRRCSGRVINSWFISGTYQATFITNPVISHEWGKEQIFIIANGIVGALFAAIMYHGNHDRNNKLWNIVSTKRYILHIQGLTGIATYKWKFHNI